MDYIAHRIFDVIVMLIMYACLAYIAYRAKND